MNVLGGWCPDLEVELKELVGGRSKVVLHNMPKAVISGTLNISRTFKAGVNVKAVLRSLNTAFLPISPSRFKLH